VVAGIICLDCSTPYTQNSAVTKATIHPNYTYVVGDSNDACLLELAQPFSLTAEKVDAITLTQNEIDPPCPCVNVSGWAQLFIGSPVFPCMKFYVLPVVDRTQCNAKYNMNATLLSQTFQVTQVNINNCLICADGLLETTCYGDSGGALVCNGKQYGIVSFGLIFCDTPFPAVFVSVGCIHNWIVSVVGSF
jgi:secreted trypsin-like serine protease